MRVRKSVCRCVVALLAVLWLGAPLHAQCLEADIDVTPGEYRVGDHVPVVLTLTCETDGADCGPCRVDLMDSAECEAVLYSMQFCCLPPGGSISVEGTILVTEEMKSGERTFCARPVCVGCGGGAPCDGITCSETVIVILADCPADIDLNGDVGYGDLFLILSAWGPCSGDCPEDLDGDLEVEIDDIIEVITYWGPCG